MVYEGPIGNDQNDALDRINAMRSQEDETSRCQNYLTSVVDASCRETMVNWCFRVVDSFHISRESVWIAMSILDRYLGTSVGGKSAEALRNRQTFQLATITSLYMAVKIHGPAQLGIRTVADICRGLYEESAIAETEREILCYLEWRVYVPTTTPMEYVRQFLDLLPEWKGIRNGILESSTKHMDCATADVYFSTCRPSMVAVACLKEALTDTRELSSTKKEILWQQLRRRLGFDIESNEIRKVSQRLLSKSKSCEHRRPSGASLPRSRVNSFNEQPSSPVSVRQVA
eukprot:CAMPEP_0172576376 /NCGR_PEP_ID=MMETSP1067-20121228/137691_1 /TAXON_ID=265564 ORGANISM="Thalassiosira punctigera, Strain Tpunct2005C2" /NCGR_SAMPLE_ID=MMETSP1067 /ASSEMBLY_ACC=CAM_ASM_000444 /LENGTH=286 /DNA_ID=CAMNT_0013369043 /DNA_START=53 /DNA_END=913 /DNA_ORIENTATION=+